MSGPTDKNDQPQSEPTTESAAQQPESGEAAVTSEPRADDGPTTPSMTEDAASETPTGQPDASDSVTDQVPSVEAAAPSAAADAAAAGRDDFTVTKTRWIHPRRRLATWLIAAGAAVVLVGAGFGVGWAAGADGGRHIEMRWDATEASPHGPGAFPQRGDQRDSGRPQLAPRDDDSQGSDPWNRQRGEQQDGRQGTDQQPVPQRDSTPALPGSPHGTQQQGTGLDDNGSEGSEPDGDSSTGTAPTQSGSQQGAGSNGNGSSGDSSTEPAPPMSSAQPSNP